MSATRRLAFHHEYLHRATVTDRSGNATTATGRCHAPRGVGAERVVRGPLGDGERAPSGWGGAAAVLGHAELDLSLPVLRAIGGLGQLKAPTRGQASVYVDGHYAARVDLAVERRPGPAGRVREEAGRASGRTR